MDRRLVWIAVCAGVGAIVVVATGDIFSNSSHAARVALAGLGAGFGAFVGTYVTRR